MHLDVCRHFFSVDQVKEYIDILALHGMNTFHWHLTDDQGWRIEIKKYPRLTEVGAWRDGTMVGGDWKSNDGIRYGGYYTKDGLKANVITAIQDVHRSSFNENQSTYDLQGRRLNQTPKKGLYIRNGKKVVLR